MSYPGNASPELVDAMLDKLPLMFWTSGADGAAGRWNEQARRWLGISRDKARGPLTEFVHPDDREGTLSRWQRAVSDGQPLNTTFRLQSASGERRWITLAGAPRRDEEGRVAGWICSLVDAHECRPPEGPLKAGPAEGDESNRLLGLVSWRNLSRIKGELTDLDDASLRLKTLIGNSPLAVIEWDPERRITGWMGNSEGLFGWSAAEVTGKRLDEFGFIHPDDEETVRIALGALEHGSSSVVRNRNYHKNGSVIYCEWHNSALVDQSGRLVWGLSVALDITARRMMENALRASEERYRNIFEAAPVGIFQSTAAGRFLGVNAKLADMFRYDSPEEMVRDVTDIATQLFVDSTKRRGIVQRSQEASDFVLGEVEYRRKDGSTFLSNLYMRTVRRAGGETFLEGFVEDVTERKRAEAALLEAHDALERRVAERTAELSAANERLTELDRLKSQFLASMSHELRTPLNSIIGFTSLLRRGLPGPVNDEQGKQLDIVRNSASHLLALINDLLDVSRIEAGRADLHIEQFDFAGVVNEVVRSLQPMADRKGISVGVNLAEPAIPMLGDRKRSLQVLLNLATNAVKFTEEGSVTIAAAASNGALRVEVADTGIGIKAEHIGMLFEAFRQVDGSARKVYEGTGLGLYLCRKLLTLMGGAIRVESEYGKGSRFHYSMPLELNVTQG